MGASVVTDILDGVDPAAPGYDNIARVHRNNAATVDSDGVFYNIQQMGGTSLLNYLGKVGFSKELAYRVLKQGSLALSLLQAKNYAHFDLKFENFVVKCEDSKEVVKMIDFAGCTKYGKREKVPTTTGYIPPELYKGVKSCPEVDSKHDIYSLGVIFMLIRCKEAVPVWNGTSTPVTHENLHKFVKLDKLPESEQRLLKGMLHKDPSKRWSLQQVMTVFM